MSDDTFTGIIVDWKDQRGYGFIGRDDGEGDAFVNIRDCLTEEDGFGVGTRVRFKMRNNQRTGRPQAYDCAEIIADTGGDTFGTIAKWGEDGRFCFISPDAANGEDVFAHHSAFGGDAYVPVGARVRFTVGINPRNGRPRALTVRVA